MEPNKYEKIVLLHMAELQHNNDYLTNSNHPMTEDKMMQVIINKAMINYLATILKEMGEA